MADKCMKCGTSQQPCIHDDMNALRTRIATLEAEVKEWKRRADRDSDKLDAIHEAMHPGGKCTDE